MAVSAVSICNRALQLLGDESIVSLTDDNNRARAMNLAYEPIRRRELQVRRWRFSISRASLPALADTPDSGYAYQYQLPNDFLRLIEGGDLLTSADLTDFRGGEESLFSIEGQAILTDIEAPLSIRYLRDVTDAASFHPAFVETLSVAIAIATCERLTGSASKLQELRDMYSAVVKDAARANALERASISMADDTWVIGRAQ
jgi:hypothetical protein